VRHWSVLVAVGATAILPYCRAWAAVSVDAVTTFDSGRFTASFSFDHTVGPGSDRYLIVAVADGNLGTATTAVTYGGVALSRIDVARGRDIASELWGLASPPVGPHPIVVTLDSKNDRPLATALSLDGVDQGAPAGAAGTASGTGTAASVDVATVPGDFVLNAAGAWTQRPTVSGAAATGQTELWNLFNGRETVVMGGQRTATGTTTTMSWTLTGDQPSWATITVPIKASLAATPDAAMTMMADAAVAPAPDGSSADARPYDTPSPADTPTGDPSDAPIIGRGQPQDAGEPSDSTAGAADVPGDAAQAPVRVSHLQVGSACAISGDRPAGLLTLLVGLAAGARRRARR
jgi:hypothetical protein